MQATADATTTVERNLPAKPKPARLPAPVVPAKSSGVRIRQITVAEYHRLGEAGIVGPGERVELLDGQLIKMPPIGPPHDYTVACLTHYFHKRFGDRAFIKVQGAVTLDKWSEPQPDVALNALPADRYAIAHPTPAEVLLIVEVAASSLAYDAGLKMRAYARRRVREYWIVDLGHQHIDVYREPQGGRYKNHQRAGRGHTVAPLAFPDDAIAVNDILPPLR
jgi:Uma2 family endonuclease